MNWGHGITITFILFAAFMIALVKKSFDQQIDLVTENYYGEELAYQSRINEIENASSQYFVVESRDDHINIQLNGASKTISGTLHLYRPSDSRFDKHFTLSLTGNSQNIPTKGIPNGYYILKLSWSIGDKNFYQEKGIFLG